MSEKSFIEMAKKSNNLMEINMLEFFDKRRIQNLNDVELLEEMKKMKLNPDSKNSTGRGKDE